MESEHIAPRSIPVMAWMVGTLAVQIATEAWSQPAWRPEKAVEIILPTAPGGTNDQMARLMQKILQDHKLVTVPLVVIAKYLESEYIASRTVLTDLGFAK